MANINVVVVYALPDDQLVIPVSCPYDSSIEAVIQLSGILDTHPEIDLNQLEVGVYGFKQEKDFPVKAGDRVEIYRPLLLSPTDARRLRARCRQKSK